MYTLIKMVIVTAILYFTLSSLAQYAQSEVSKSQADRHVVINNAVNGSE